MRKLIRRMERFARRQLPPLPDGTVSLDGKRVWLVNNWYDKDMARVMLLLAQGLREQREKEEA